MKSKLHTSKVRSTLIAMLLTFAALVNAQTYDMFFWCSGGSPMGLSGVDVTIDGVTVTSDFDGLALFEGYAPGSYDYSASKAGYVSQTGTVTVVDQNIQEFVVMVPATYDMFFWCSGGSPMGLSGVDVTIDGVTVTSDFDGLALFEGYAPGSYDYSASKAGYVTQTGTVTLIDQNIQEFVVMVPATYDMFFWCSELGSPMGMSGVDVTINGVTVTSDFDGLALFEGYDPGDYDYSASKAGYVTQTGTVTLADQNIQEFVVMPLAIYDMFFWCSEQGSPMGMSGVDVTIDGVTVTSDFDGLALFEGYAPGDYDYAASKAGFETQTGTVTLVDQNIQEFVVMVPAIYDMFFWCSELGSPMGMSGVDVTIDGVTVTSDFDGLALFEGYAPGDYDYAASKAEFETQTGTVTLVDQNIQEFVVMVPAIYDMFFWCSELGSPMGMSGVDVTINGVTVTSDFDGLALFEGYDPGDYDYSASKAGYVTQTGTVTLVDQNIQEFVVMVPTYSVTVIVNDGEEPVEDAIVNLSGDVVLTDIMGEAVFTDFAPGTYYYTVAKFGYISQTGTITVVDQDVEETVVMPLALYDMFFWCNEEGSPMGLSGVDVTIDGVTVTSDFDGLALFEDYGPGSYAYEASKDGFITQMGTVTISDGNIQEFVIMPLAIYDIFFWCSEEGNPMGLSGVDVTIDGVTVTSDFDGLALFEGYAPGTYEYEASKEGYITQTGTVTVVDQNIQEFVVLSPAYEVTFFVNDGREPIEGAEVTFNGQIIFTDENGEATFSQVAAGTYTYMISMNGYFAQEGTVDVNGEDITVTINLIITGLDINYFNEVSIYPNPSRGNVNIDNAENSTIHIIDQNGLIIRKEAIINGHSTINLATNPAGVYNILLISGQNVSSHRLLIVK